MTQFSISGIRPINAVSRFHGKKYSDHLVIWPQPRDEGWCGICHIRICLLAERQEFHTDEGKAGFKLKTAQYFKSGDLVAGTVYFYSISIDIQNHF